VRGGEGQSCGCERVGGAADASPRKIASNQKFGSESLYRAKFYPLHVSLLVTGYK
jgi:hypothetical protein